MKEICIKPTCGLNVGLNCDRGESNLAACPHYRPNAPAAAGATAEPPLVEGDAIRLPWTGRALGVNDMLLVSARSPAELIGFIGPFNAGKTSLLTALFAHLAKTGEVAGHDFAGSFSLDGWTKLREFTKWPAVHSHSFPPHTPDSSERVPSLLHLAFRKAGGQIKDCLFTDAPGEWFTRWVRNQGADDAAGARWIAENATQFVFVIDREGLAGKEVGLNRNNTLLLARVLSEWRRGRPLTVVWAKSNSTVNEEIEKPMRAKLQELFGDHLSLNLAVDDPRCLALLASALETRPRKSQVAAPSATNSAFLAYQGATS